MRRAHKKVTVDMLTSCKECGEWRRPHHMCNHCGYYNGRQVIVPKARRRAAAQEARE